MQLDLTIEALQERVRAREVSAVELCDEVLRRIAALNPQLNAILEVLPEAAHTTAQAVDKAIAHGDAVGPLAGVPVVVKDNISTQAGHTTCASRALENYRAPFDATVIQRLRAAGAVVVAKANLDEFAMGSSNEHSARGPVRNPWNPELVPGGSSGGAAAAVAARIAPAALGSDTGGSIRQPASLCGIVGLKPSYGRVSRFGLVAFGSSLDQIGPLALTVADAALLLAAIAGADPADSTCAARSVPDYASALTDAALEERRESLRVGVPQEYFSAGLDGEVRSAIEAALEVYRAADVEVRPIHMPHAQHSVATYYLIATAEASSNLARFDGVHYGRRAADPENIFELYSRSRDEGFGAEVKRRIMLGTFALSAGYSEAFYDKALRVRRLIQADFDKAFEEVDVIAGPVSPTPAFGIGAKRSDPLAMYLADLYTLAANLAGVPAISVPAGYNSAGLPIGLQLHARPFEETTLLQAARLYERATQWASVRRPVVCAA